MQELTDAFIHAHPTFNAVGMVAMVAASLVCLFLAWRDRHQLWAFHAPTIAPLPLLLQDYFFLPCFLLLLLSGLIGELLVVTGILSLWKLRTDHFSTYLKLSIRDLPGSIALGLLVAAGITLPLETLLSLVEETLTRLGYPPAIQPAIKLFMDATSLKQIFPLLFLATFVAPIVEEFLFRGVVYTSLKKYVSPFYAMIISGFLFAAIHLHLPSFLPLMLLGMLLCRILERTGSLWTGIFIHAFFNGLTAAYLCLAKFYS